MPAVGVDHLRLGMRERAARRVLRTIGSPGIARRQQRGPGLEYVELRYPRNASEPLSYVVGVERTASARTVVLVSVHTRRNRTTSGIRIGDSEARLRRAYPRVDCRATPFWNGTRGLFCTVGDRRKRNTVFLLSWVWQPGSSNPVARIIRIAVREPFVDLEPDSQA